MGEIRSSGRELSFLGLDAIPADHAALLASLCREGGPGGPHGVSAVFRACSRARREQGLLQGSFGMKADDLGLGHQQRPRSRLARLAHTEPRAEGWSGERKTPVLVLAHPARLPLGPADKDSRRGSEPSSPEDNRAAPAPGCGVV